MSDSDASIDKFHGDEPPKIDGRKWLIWMFFVNFKDTKGPPISESMFVETDVTAAQPIRPK